MNHYEILGVDRNASDDDIKRAYRKLAAKHHPDRGGSTAKFQEIQQAYDNLSDPQKRAAYDNPQPQFNGGFGGFNFGGGPSIDDLFQNIMRQHQRSAQVYRTTMWVTLEQVLYGGEETLRIQTPDGNPVHAKIQIPRGVFDSMQVRLDNIIQNASLVVEFKTQQHLKFQRNGANLYCNHQISVLKLITGTVFNIETLSGTTLQVTVPPYTQPSKTLKISGGGLPYMNTGRMGDLFINLSPYVPENLPQDVLDSISTVA